MEQEKLYEKQSLPQDGSDLTPYLASYSKTTATTRKISDKTKFMLYMNAYRRFFVFIVVINWIGLALAAANVWTWGKQRGVSLATFNIFMAVAMRSEFLFRGIYWLVVKLFAKWPPIAVRHAITLHMQGLGGVHSGCAIAGVSWLLFQVVLVFLDPKQPAAVKTLATLTLVALIIGTASAIPRFRERHHNWFESFHRYTGWSAVVTLWLFIFISALYESNDAVRGGDNWVDDTTNATLWLTVLITILIGVSWSSLRKVPIECRLQPSGKMALLVFQGGVQQGLLGRIGRHPFEFHGFGIISENDTGPNATHVMCCGVQGDFTKALVNDGPKTIYTRQLRFAGLPYLSTLYRRGVCICTGSGVGAVLSTCLQSPDWFFIWIGSDLLNTFGPTLFEMIERRIPPERRIVWDTKLRGGRPDTMKLLENVYHTFGAEMIIITSNPQGNKDIMEGCRERGMRAAGPLWDS